MLDYNMKPFRFWCQKVLPLVYDDSLSYMELLSKVVNYLNHVIEDINGIPDYINQLISDDKLAEIMSELLDELREQIARANEGTNTTASYDRDKDELVWLNGKLVRLTRDILAGDRYILDDESDDVTGNYVYTSIEIELKRINSTLTTSITDLQTTLTADITALRQNISDEESAREQADTTLQNNIDSEATTREQADTTLQNNIDSEANTREQADTTLQNSINNLSAYYNVKNYGALGDGTNDDTQAFKDAILACSSDTSDIGSKTVYVPSGTYIISSRIVIPKGISLIGAGWVPSTDGNEFKGSWLFITDSTQRSENHETVDYTDDGTICLDAHTELKNIGFYYPNVTYTSNPDLQYTIYVRAVGDVIIDNIFSHNSPNFIFLNNQHSNVSISNVMGFPIRHGIVSVFQGDRDWFKNISFHQGYGMSWASDINTGISWINTHAIGFTFYGGDYGVYENLSAYHYFKCIEFGTFDFVGTTKYCREFRFSDCFFNAFTCALYCNNFSSLFFDNCLIASDSNTQPLIFIINGDTILFNDCNFRSYNYVIYTPNSQLNSIIINGCNFAYFGIDSGDGILADAKSNVIVGNNFNMSNSATGVRAIRVYNNANETSIIGNTFFGSTTHNAITLDNHDNIRCIGNTFSMSTPIINVSGTNVITDNGKTLQFNDGIRLISRANSEPNTIYIGSDGILYFNDSNGTAHALYA